MEMKVERFPVVINGVTHLMTDEQIGNLYIEYNGPEHLQAIRLELARACGMPEPVLYDDELIGPTEDDSEELFNEMINLKERMDTGMVMIKERNEIIASFFKQHKWMPKLYTAWMQDRGMKVKYPMHGDSVKRFLTDPRNKGFIAQFNYRAKLWDHWHKLNNELNKLAKDNNLWPKYYELLNGDVTVYNTYGIDDTEVEGKDNRILPTDIAYREAHLEEEERITLKKA